MLLTQSVVIIRDVEHMQKYIALLIAQIFGNPLPVTSSLVCVRACVRVFKL